MGRSNADDEVCKQTPKLVEPIKIVKLAAKQVKEKMRIGSRD